MFRKYRAGGRHESGAGTVQEVCISRAGLQGGCRRARNGLPGRKGPVAPAGKGDRAAQQEERGPAAAAARQRPEGRSEEHTSELKSLMRNSYAVFCLKKKNKEPTRES